MFTVRSFFNWCVAENLCRTTRLLKCNSTALTGRAGPTLPIWGLAQRLIENAPTDDLRFVLFCGFHAGMRKLEIVEAVPEWFDLRAKTPSLYGVNEGQSYERSVRTSCLYFSLTPEGRTAILPSANAPISNLAQAPPNL